jgi:guanine nucleotide-binding protein subunit beta-2-like 1 protein
MVEQVDNTQEFTLIGVLEGHTDHVTAIAPGFSQKENEDSPVLVTGSRDKSLIIWNLYDEEQDGKCGKPYRQLLGHNHFVSDLSLSQENCFILSSSWDKTLRLWDLRTGKTTRLFQGHTKEALTISFSPDNRQILSAGADRKIMLWNTLADLKYVSGQDSEGAARNDSVDNINHQDWVSQIRYAPQLKTASKTTTFQPYFASVGWDGRLKVWNHNMQIRETVKAHEGQISSLSISPHGKNIATGGRDKKLLIWDISDLSAVSREFNAADQINQIAFNPKLQWVAAATEKQVLVWDLMSTSTKPVGTISIERKVKDKKTIPLNCTALAWNALGKKLYVGCNDGTTRVYQVSDKSN